MLQLDDVLARITALPDADRKAVMQEAMRATADMLWVPNPGPQSDAFYCEADEMLYGGEAGGGKGLRPTEPVLTPFGWREIGALKVGDAMCATDGTVTRVIGVYRRGVQPLYRLTFSDGATIDCDADHIWLAWQTGKGRKVGNDTVGGRASARKWTTEEIASHYRDDKGALAIPCIDEPAVFNVAGTLVGRNDYQRRTIPPYVLGVLMGDGYLGERAVKFTSADPEIAQRVEAELGTTLSAYETRSAATDYRIPNAACMAELRRLKLLGLHSDTKFIPRIYLFGSAPERWALLQGLMDTDGWAEDGRAVYFSTVSPRLADDVKHLARSLGGIVTHTHKHPHYRCNGERRDGLLAHSLRIKLPNPDRAFHLARKKAVCAGKVHQSMGRRIVSIEACGHGETVCIQVAHPNSLFIARDFIVTHNTDLAIGLALTSHRRSLLLRRYNDDARAMAARAVEVVGHDKGLNRTFLTWQLGERLIEFGGCQHEDDKQRYKGQPHDLIVFDEGSDFTEGQFEFIKTWNRSTYPDQRCRVVVPTNPPTTAEGLWIVRRWAAWLDPRHPNPAVPGEIRWFIRDEDDVEIEVDGPGPHAVGERMVKATSRTFIRSRLSDNPDLARTDYGDRLDLLPAELRNAYREGRFDASLKDQAFQVIPTAWIAAAQARWTPDGWREHTMTAIGLDPAGGGRDSMEMAYRHGGWYGELISEQGEDTRDGSVTAGLVVKHRRGGCPVVVDVGGGYAGAVIERFKDNGIPYQGFNGGNGSTAKTKDGQLGFANKRAEAWWKFREELDPEQEGGSVIALPPDPELLADLTAPTWTLKTKGILLESKDHIRDRLGRSPGKGDAVVMCMAPGNSAVKRAFNGGQAPKVVLGYANRRKRR